MQVVVVMVEIGELHILVTAIASIAGCKVSIAAAKPFVALTHTARPITLALPFEHSSSLFVPRVASRMVTDCPPPVKDDAEAVMRGRLPNSDLNFTVMVLAPDSAHAFDPELYATSMPAHLPVLQ